MDDFYDTDLEDVSEQFEKKTELEIPTTEQRYKEICKKLAVSPASKFIKQLSGTEVDLKHYGLGDTGIQAVAVALEKDFAITSVCLHDNAISESGTRSISKMLGPNCFITHLDLSSNPLGSKGFEAIGQMLFENISVQVLNLNGCSLQGKEIEKICDSLKHNSVLKELLLSYNNLGDEGTRLLGSMLARNKVLETLDISWNGVKAPGGFALSGGLRINQQLIKLDLSCNGLQENGAAAIEEILTFNKVLKILDVSNNGFHMKGAQMIAKGLQVNRTIQVLKVGRNPFQSSGACLLLKAANRPKSALHELNLDHIVFDKQCEQELNAVLILKAGFICSWDVSIKGGRVDAAMRQPEVWELFLEFLRIRGWRLIDIFKILAQEKDAKHVTWEEFFVGLKKLNVPLSDKQINELFLAIDSGDNGVAEITEFCALNGLRILSKRRQQKRSSSKYSTTLSN